MVTYNTPDSIFDKNQEESIRIDLLYQLIKEKAEPVNILITGSTGCGKSSTINALFGDAVAKLGSTPDPETMTIDKYNLPNMVLWDSPGLGDGIEKDRQHAENIKKKLTATDNKGNKLIDIALVIIDGSSRDLGTAYELINKVVLPNIEDKKRVIIAINQADMAMKGRYWDSEASQPAPELENFLNEKVRSIKNRIKEATDIDVEPIYYSAGYYNPDKKKQETPYNLSKLLYLIVKNTPEKKDYLI